jgi:hypothetical protein
VTVAEFREEVRSTVEDRLEHLGVEAAPLPADELESRYGRRATGEAIHYRVSLGGTDQALTVTPLDQEQVDDYRPVLEVTEEVERLQREGRAVPYHQVIVAPRGSVMLDLVAGNGGQADPSAGMAFLQRLLDHDVVRRLM